MRHELKISALVILHLFHSGCGRQNDQVFLEHQYAKDLRFAAQAYLVEHGRKSSNWTNLSVSLDKHYLSVRQEQFKKLGRYSGFTNSISEKYQFLDSDVPLPSLDAKAFMISARPFPFHGKSCRIVFFVRTNNSVGWIEMSENDVRETMFPKEVAH